MRAAVYDWIDQRLSVTEALKIARKKTVPVHAHSFWYYWGGITLLLFLVQAFTGVLLLLYYRPGGEAYESVRQITYQMQFGWLIRSAHSWSANLMILAIFIHMFSVFFMKAYRMPREFGWFSGMGLLMVAVLFGFSGYLLPMDELSYFATKVGLQMIASLPLVGHHLADLIRGGPDVNEFTVERFFALHVVVLPAMFLPLLGFHLWLVQKHGNAVPQSEALKPLEHRRAIPFFPNFFAKDMAMWLIALNVLALMASLFPWGLGKPADALMPAPAGIHPEWYFMPAFEALKLLGKILPGAAGEAAGMLLFNGALVLWLLIPFYDGASKTGRRGRRTHYLGIAAVSAVAALTIGGYWTVS